MSFLRDHARRSRKAVILDVDGTLVDSNDGHARAWVDAFTEAGILVDYEQVRRAIGMGGDKLMPHVSGIAETSPEGRRISERRAEIFAAKYLPHVRPLPRVRELVERFINDNFTVVVASSAKEDELHGLLERAGVADLIEEQTSSEDAGRSKPDPDIVRAALERSKASPEAAVMLGDTPYDVEAARRCGVSIVGVESGGWRREDLAGTLEVHADTGELYERYDESVFARVQSREVVEHRPGSGAAIDFRLIAFVAAGVAGVALIFFTLRAVTRRRTEPDDAAAHRRRPGLTARDRERLRYLIEHTS